MGLKFLLLFYVLALIACTPSVRNSVESNTPEPNKNGTNNTSYQNVSCHASVKIPSVFYPNREGSNNRFEIVFTLPPKSFSIEIYNRWGEKIFETNDYKKLWDGTQNGKALPAEVFFWVLNFKTAKEEDITCNGSISLVR